jgi:hypothetical protein
VEKGPHSVAQMDFQALKVDGVVNLIRACAHGGEVGVFVSQTAAMRAETACLDLAPVSGPICLVTKGEFPSVEQA